MMKVGCIEYFDSSHMLPGHPKCGVPHGHTYKVEVTVAGELKNGMVIDFADLKAAVRGLLKQLDHKDLNTILPYPTCENISNEILGRLKQSFPHNPMCVRVWEGDGKWAEIEG